MLFLDTHAAVFLWEGRVEVFGDPGRHALERCALRLSPVVRLELALLREIGRLSVDPDEVVRGLETDCGVVLAEDPIHRVVRHALDLTWVRDPFDRLIVATALLHDARLLTRDRRIQASYPKALW